MNYPKCPECKKKKFKNEVHLDGVNVQDDQRTFTYKCIFGHKFFTTKVEGEPESEPVMIKTDEDAKEELS